MNKFKLAMGSEFISQEPQVQVNRSPRPSKIPRSAPLAVPDIRYSTLTMTDHSGHEGHEEGEKPYTDELIKRAIMEGLDTGGETLKPPMPVFQMSESDLNDMLEYLKSLK